MPEDILLPPPPKKRLEVVGSDGLLPPPPKKKSGESTSINLKDGVQIQEPTSTSSRLSVPTFNDSVLGGKSPKQEQVQPTTDEQLNSFNEQTKRMLSGQGVGMQNKEAALSKPFEPLNKKEALAIQEEKGIEHKQNAEKGIGITAEKRLTAQGIKPTEENLTTEKAKVLEDIKSGKLSYNPSTKTYQRDAGVIEGFLKGFNKNLINASYGITKGINAALGNDNTEKENQQKAELESIERDPYGSMLHSLNIFKTDEDKRLLEVAKKTSGNELNYEGLVPSLGSLAGDIIYFNPTNFVAGTLPKIGTALAMGYTKNYGEKSNEIYSQLKNEGYSDEDAAKKASIDATAQAIPNTIFEAALFGGVIPHAKPAEDFLSSIGQMAKRTVAFSAANAPVQGLDEAIKGMQGYDTKGWEGRVKSAVLNGMGMVALMEGFPILAKLPKYTQSAFKEFANQPAIRPLVDKALENLPYGEKVKQQLDAYKATTEPLRGVVPDEKMAAIGGLQEKRNNIQAIIDGVATSMKQLETDKKSAPALEKNFDGKILLYQKFIDDKQSEIDAIDKKIKTFDKSDNPIEEEVDDATGQTAKQENETTRQPIATEKPIEEITTVPIETEVSGSTKKQPGEIIQPTEEVKVEEPNVSESNPALKDVEGTTKALDELPKSKQDDFYPNKPRDIEGIPLQPLSFEGGNTYDRSNPKSIAEAYHKDKAAGKETELTKAVESLLSKEQPKTESNVSETKVKELRASEQAELDSRIANAEQYRVDGKVDRSKLTNDADRKAFDEVYEVYDKLITPLLEKEGSAGVGELKLTDKTKDILDEVTDEKIGEKKYQDFSIDFSDGARAFGRIVDGVASISGINAPKEKGETIRGSKTYERVLTKLKEQGIETISIKLQSEDSSKAIEKLVEKGVLINPRDKMGSSFDERNTTFDIGDVNKKSTPKVEAEKVITKPTISEEPPLPKGETIVTLNGLTESERQALIEQRKKTTSLTDQEKTENKLVALDKKRNSKNILPTEKRKINSEISQMVRALNAKAGYEKYKNNGVFVSKSSTVRKGNIKGSTRYKRLSEVNRDANNGAISDDAVVFVDRPKNVRDNYDALLDGEHLQYLYVLDASGKKAMSKKQIESAMSDIENGIPSVGADTLLNTIEQATKDGNLPVIENGSKVPIPLDLVLQSEKEIIGEPFDEKSLMNWLNEESHNLTPEQEQILDNELNNIIYEYEQGGIETEIPKSEPTTEATSGKVVESKVSDATVNEKTQPTKQEVGEVNNIFTESDNPTREGKSKKALIDAKKEVFEKYQETYGENVKDKVKDINTNFDDYIKSLKEIGEIIKIEC